MLRLKVSACGPCFRVEYCSIGGDSLTESEAHPKGLVLYFHHSELLTSLNKTNNNEREREREGESGEEEGESGGGRGGKRER